MTGWQLREVVQSKRVGYNDARARWVSLKLYNLLAVSIWAICRSLALLHRQEPYGATRFNPGQASIGTKGLPDK